MNFKHDNMKTDNRTNKDYARRIIAYERKIKSLRQEQMDYLHDKYLHVEENVFFWAKKLTQTQEGIVLDGISVELDEESFVVDLADNGNFLVDNLNELVEMTPEAFYDVIKQGLNRFRTFILTDSQITREDQASDNLLNRYFQIENNDLFYVQKIERINKNGITLSGLNVVRYPHCVLFVKELMNCMTQPEEIKETTREVFHEHIQNTIAFLEDIIPEKYK